MSEVIEQDEVVATPAETAVEPSVGSSTERASEAPWRRGLSRLLRTLERADPGTLAALRRADPSSPPPAFFRVSVEALDGVLPDGGPLRQELDARWLTIATALATAQGLLGRAPFGEALAHAGVAEARVLRLLDAGRSQLADLVRHVVHQLVQKAQSFDPADLADLVLTAETERSQEPRRRIARTFYRHFST